MHQGDVWQLGITLNWIQAKFIKKFQRHFCFDHSIVVAFFVVTRTRIAWQFPMIIVTLKVLSITRKSAHSIWGITFEKESTDCMWNYYFKRDTIQTSTDMSRDRQKDKEHWVSYLRNMFFTGVSIWSLQPLQYTYPYDQIVKTNYTIL